jgi:hypothetical protein
MGRFIGLSLIILSLFYVPLNASALDITGTVWTNAPKYAANPGLVYDGGILTFPSDPAAQFKATDINFNSTTAQISGNPPYLSFDAFLHPSSWTMTSNDFKPDSNMNAVTGGSFFSFEWDMEISPGVPITIVHDDGYFLLLSNGKTFSNTEPTLKPVEETIYLDFAPGQYHFTLTYGALNAVSALNDAADTAAYSHVLIIRTPEPGTILLLGFGLVAVGVAILMRRRT